MENKKLEPLIQCYLERELNIDLTNITITHCYHKIIHNAVVYEVTTEDNSTLEEKKYYIDNLQLLSFIFLEIQPGWRFNIKNT